MTQFVLLCLIPVAVGLIIGYAWGGRLVMLAGQFRAIGLLWLAVAVQAVQYYSAAVRHFVEEQLSIPMLVVVSAIGLGWLILNARHWRFAMRVAACIVLLGAILNSVAIMANGRMPYSPAAAIQAGHTPDQTTPKNEPASDGTRFAHLGDIVPVPPLHKVVSIGDLLIGVGTVVLLSAGMRRMEAGRAEKVQLVTRGGEP